MPKMNTAMPKGAKPKKIVYLVSFEFSLWGEETYSSKFLKEELLEYYPEAKKVKVEKISG